MKAASESFLLFMTLIFTFVGIAIFPASALSGTNRKNAASANEMRKIFRAKTPAELTAALRGQKKQQKNKMICDAQLKADRIPTACFELLFDADPQSSSERLNMEWLVSTCVSRASKTQDWTELERSATNERLPKACRETAARRRDDIMYVDQAERPAEVFSRQLSLDDGG
jgi:hypothetical protein